MEGPKLQFDSAREYWDAAANTYDVDFTSTLIGKTRRSAVWREVDRVFQRDERILELNCGTGIDAVHLASRGIRVVACDISSRMIEIARQSATAAKVIERIDFRVLPTEDIGVLAADGPFDGAFSNFAGLNCVEDLPTVVRNLAMLLKPGASAVISMMGRFVPWEIVWFLAHGHPRKAFRRILENSGTLSWGPLKIQQPSVRAITSIFAEGFTRRAWKGIGIAVPPSYMEDWACRFPNVTETLARADEWIGWLPPLRHMADCVLLEFERKRVQEIDNEPR